MKKKKPLKRSMNGFEIEMFTLDNGGRIVPAALQIIKEVRKKYPEVEIAKECGTSMLEVRSFPEIDVYDTSLNLLKNAEKTNEVAESMGFLLYPFATYPGKFTPELADKEWYKAKRLVLKVDHSIKESKCAGFHFHYTLPKGVFDKRRKHLKPMFDSKIKQTLIDSYNMLIAIDPILTTFMQSSPFFDGKHLAKDSRLLVYRGSEEEGRPLRYDGVYSELQEFGALPRYEHTCADLVYMLDIRYGRWKKLMMEKGFTPRKISQFGEKLKFAWNPIRINPIGTMEQRGMDMNYLSHVIAMGTIIKYVLREIQREFLFVVPSDIGVKEPFKREGNVLLIPPHSFVRHKYQVLSATEGLADDLLFNYCKRFMAFADKCIPQEYKGLVGVVKAMLEERKTVSDRIIGDVKKAGLSLEKELPEDFMRELVIKYNGRMCRDMKETKKTLEKLAGSE